MEPTATQWLRQLQTQQITSRELSEHYLDRIAAVNPVINAVVAYDPELVLAEADQADRRRRDGCTSPLLGLPVTIKDNLDVAGLPCQAGSRARHDVPTTDAEVVRRLRRAGALVIGKTNMPELGSSYESHNRVYGRTNHPLDSRLTPGGSSGGEAAILGADASPVGIGTDGGGSIRVPSHYCGLIGIRPTVGRVPVTGSWPEARGGGTFDITCIGPMGRSTGDVALLLEVISGPDLIDPFAHPVPLRSWTDVDATQLCVGWYVDDGVAAPTEPTAAAVRAAAETLQRVGATVQQVDPPNVTRATELFFRASAADGGAGTRNLVGDATDDHTPQFLDLLRAPPYGSSTGAGDYFELLREIFEFRSRVRRWLSEFDVVIAPVAAGTAPMHNTAPANVPQSEYSRYEAFNYTHTYSIAGLPAASVPAAASGGLPIGVQVIGPPWREDLILAACGVIERDLGGYAITDALR